MVELRELTITNGVRAISVRGDNDAVFRVVSCYLYRNDIAIETRLRVQDEIVNCLITQNQTGYSHSYYGKDSFITNSTFADNVEDVRFDPGWVSGLKLKALNSVFRGQITGNSVNGMYLQYCNYDPTKLGTNVVVQEGCQTENPLFVDQINGDYSLQVSSPCIDAGTSEGAPSDDIEGTPRPVGSGFDLGAYELVLMPTATTTSATSPTSTSATLNGTVNPNGAETTVVFEWGLDDSYGYEVTATESPITGVSDQSVSGIIARLTPNTTYHFRVRATNSKGTTYGDDLTFSTLYNLTVHKVGTGSGTVISSPAGVDCGSDCSGDYAAASDVTLTATPNINSIFSGWSGDCSGTDPHVIVNMDSNKVCTASFALKTYTVQVTASSGGSTDRDGANVMNHGGSLVITATPDPNYHFTEWSGDASGTSNPLTLANITSDVNITAAFAINTYTITASAGTGGTISPSGAVIVGHGSDQAFTITPDTGYSCVDVLVSASSVGAVTTYTFTNVTANQTISALFAICPCQAVS